MITEDMAEDILSMLAKKITGMSEKEAAREFIRLASVIQPRRENELSLTLSEAIQNFALRQKPKVLASLPRRFGPFAESFFLTPGLHVIAGLTGHGKTLWAMEWAKYVEGETLMLSLEMSPDDLAIREISQMTDLELKDLYRSELTPVQKQLIRSLDFERLDRFHYRSYGSMDWSEIRLPLEQDILKLRPKLLIIDFIQLLEDSENEDSGLSRVYLELCRYLRAKAVEEDFAVILLSQLNRDAYYQARKPELLRQLGHLPLGVESLKESGGIAEAADSVSFVILLGKLQGCPPELQGLMQVSVEKSRALGRQKPALFKIDYQSMKFQF